jgi:DNA-binding CsgD family transcriptional regulator
MARDDMSPVLTSQFAQGRLLAAHRLFVEGAALSGGENGPQAVRLLIQALDTAWRLGDRALIADIAARLKAMDGSGAEPLAPLVQLMLWLAAQAGEWVTDSPSRLADLVAAARRSRACNRDDLAMIAMVCLVTGRNTDARDLTVALIADSRAQGSTGSLPALLTYLTQALLFDGWHRAALASASEALRAAQDTGQTHWAIEAIAIMAYLAAVDGGQARCSQLVDATLTGPTTHSRAGTPWTQWALGLLDLSHGRLDTALVRLESVFRGPMRHHRPALQNIPDLVEAAVRLGQPQRAAEPLARFSQWARHAATPGTDALVERCRALVANEDAERHYLAALELHEESFERARTQLLYGAWLRRCRRKSDARTQLRAAVDYLDRIDARPWAERARAELNAASGTTTQPSQAGLPRLTSQELQVTRLAAQGLSNRDIAAQLFLSPRTVGYHLYKAYPKLGITSRSQLDLRALELGWAVKRPA